MVANRCLCLAFLLLTIIPTVQAEEGGYAHYFPGGANSFIDALPGKPSVALVNFFTFYKGETARQLSLGGQLAASVDATVYADTIGVIWQTPLKLLGGLYATGILLPFIYQDVTGTIQGGPFGGTTTNDESGGLADLLLYPFMLGWTAFNDELKYDFRFGIYAPTGEYEIGSLANIGRNYWTFEPGFMASYISHKIGLEVSSFIAIDFNLENPDTDYTSGESFHIDYTVAEHFPLWGGFMGIGADGFYYEQFGADRGPGAVLGSFKGNTVGIGPVLSYATKVKGNDLATELKWAHELTAEHRLEGDFIWFKVAYLL